jgi:hypothetical protein
MDTELSLPCSQEPATGLSNESVQTSLTSWSLAIFEKPPVTQQLNNFLTFYGTRRFVFTFKRALQCSLS